jgi:hypothetical protein
MVVLFYKLFDVLVHFEYINVLLTSHPLTLFVKFLIVVVVVAIKEI